MKKDFHKSKYGLSLGVALLLSQFTVFGGDFFDNNLLKVDLNKTSPTSVKVTLYTKNPYKEMLSVNKKSDFQYVILLPETVSSITSKPSLASTSDVIQNIEVKTQQLTQDVAKGYTKIIISTNKPVEIVAQNQVLNTSDYKVTESDYKELIAQAGKKPVAQKMSATASTATPTKKPEPKKEATIAKKPVQQAPSASKQTVKKQVVTAVKQKPVTKPSAQKVVEQKPATKPVEAISTQAATQSVTEKPATNILTTTVQPPVEQTAPTLPDKTQMPVEETPVQKIINIIKANLTMFAGGALLIPLILLLFFMKKGKKPVSEIKEELTKQEIKPNIQEPQEEIIDEDLTEEELPSEDEIISLQGDSKIDKKEEIDTLFNQDTVNDILTKEHQKQIEDTYIDEQQVDKVVQEVSQEITEEKSEETAEEPEEEPHVEPAEEPKEEIFEQKSESIEELSPLPETEISSLENFEPFETFGETELKEEVQEQGAQESEEIIENLEEETIDLPEIEPELEQQEIIEKEENVLSENLSDVADLEEFLEVKEEIVESEESEQSQMQETLFEGVDLESLSFEEPLSPVQEPAEEPVSEPQGQIQELSSFEALASLDEITEEKIEPEAIEAIEKIEELTTLEDITAQELSQINSTTSLDEFETAEEEAPQKHDDELVEELFEQEEETFFEQDAVDEEEVERKENEILLNSLGLKSRSEFAVDCEKGFHLVDFEGSTALIGYINEEIFVLKRFDETVKSQLQVRLSERKSDKEDYMVKAGSFKAIIEVSPYNMELVIEL